MSSFSIQDLPAVNATFNGIALFFMLAAYVAIKNRKPERHRTLMSLAIGSSGIFLACYLVYHFGAEAKKYTGTAGWFFYPMLISHIILAATIPFLVFGAVYYAIKNNLATHRRIVKYAFPIWLYVSVTGILIFWMVHT